MPGAALSQAEIMAALANILSNPGPLRRIDTHAATVFLAGERALKIKRAVRFPFLDYSTLERRKAACEAEIGVNRPLAPNIYKGVVAITQSDDGSVHIGGAGTPIEWAVDMTRFDEEATLDRLADRGLIDDRLADALARVIVAAHKPAAAAEAEPWLVSFRSFIDQNDDAFRSNPRLFPPADVRALLSLSVEAFAHVEPLLSKRGAAGFVKRLHGDLHLGNIVLMDGRPVLFDAIEFDPLVATGDVLYDLAFLIMDLTERGLRSAANIVLNRYLREWAEPSHLDALAALPLFLSMRAAIRAKVTAARCERVKGAELAAAEELASKYFKFALEFLKPPPPMLLAVGGLSGTGKSVLAGKLAPTLGPVPGAIVLRSDVERKRLSGVDEFKPLPSEAYSPDVTKRTYSSLARKAEQVIKAAHSVIVDAVYADAGERAEIAEVAVSRHVAFGGLFLTADLATRLSRVGQRSGDASDADRNVVLKQSRYDLGKLDWLAVDAAGTPQQTLAAAEKKLAPVMRRLQTNPPPPVHPDVSRQGLNS